MTNKELSDKLCELGCELEALSTILSDIKLGGRLEEISKELHNLSGERYDPPKHTTWADLKGQLPKKSRNYPF